MYQTGQAPELFQSTHEPSTPPSKEEIQKIIKDLARGKATGPDQISAEVLQAGGQTALEMTHSLISHIWISK